MVRGYWYFRLIASLRFHVRRLRGEYRRKKLVYFHTVLRRFWDSVVESLFMHNRTLVLRLQRLFGFPLPDAVFNNTWARVTAIQNYAPARYPGKVWLFRALDVPQIPETDETLGWKEIVDGGVEVVFVDGTMNPCFKSPTSTSLVSVCVRHSNRQFKGGASSLCIYFASPHLTDGEGHGGSFRTSVLFAICDRSLDPAVCSPIPPLPSLSLVWF